MSITAEDYRACKKLQVCVTCRKQDAFTLVGRPTCAECAERRIAVGEKYREAHRETINQAAADRTAARIAAGVCTYCGKRKPKPGKHNCDVCLGKKRRQRARRIEGTKIPMPERNWYGLCTICSRPVKEGLTTIGNPYKLCELCTEKRVKASKIAHLKPMAEDHPWRRDEKIRKYKEFHHIYD